MEHLDAIILAILFITLGFLINAMIDRIAAIEKEMKIVRENEAHTQEVVNKNFEQAHMKQGDLNDRLEKLEKKKKTVKKKTTKKKVTKKKTNKRK